VAIFRALLLLFLVAVCVCVAAYLIKGNRRYLRWAGLLFKLAVAAGLLFFAVLLLERLV
jgi:uncharacterized membrane protein